MRALVRGAALLFALSASSLGSQQATAAPSLVRGPYLQLGTPTSMVVRWRTDLPTETVLSYGPVLAAPETTLSNLALVTEHEVHVVGLTPATRYFYEVRDASQLLAGRNYNHFFKTSPLPGTREPIRIWVIGDSGACATSNQACVDAAKVTDAYLAFAAAKGNRRADLWLMLGDNAYNSGRFRLSCGWIGGILGRDRVRRGGSRSRCGSFLGFGSRMPFA
jgi:phosphodiesterase/alkaline phosphatase D-like protein